MRIMTLHTKNSKKNVAWVVLLGAIFFASFLSLRAVAISESDLDKFAANNIMFYDPDSNCSGGYTSSICGSSAKEKYWSALRKVMSAEAAAAVLGNSANEGGFSPIGVESCSDLRPYEFSKNEWINGWESWDYFVEHPASKTGNYTGVGAFGITAYRDVYLRSVRDDHPELYKYFKEVSEYAPYIWKYGMSGCAMRRTGFANAGEEVLDHIGDTDFNALVEVEVAEMLRELKLALGEKRYEEFIKMTDVDKASRIFTAEYERCRGCNGEPILSDRAADSKKAYEEFKDYKCNSAGTKTESVPNIKTTSSGAEEIDKTKIPDFTLVGDSISVLSSWSYKEVFPKSAFLSMISGRFTSEGGSGCSGDMGGLDVLKQIAKGSGKVKTLNCEDLEVKSDSLKNNIVWEMGSNNNGVDGEKSVLEEVLKIADGRNVFLVTIYNGKMLDNSNKMSEMYRQFAEAHDNVYIIDWNKAVSADPGKYLDSRDELHPRSDNSDGRDLMTRLIASALIEHGSGGCTPYEGEYPQYFQGDPKWGTTAYGSDNTISNAGCGPSSLAMLITYVTGEEVTPVDTAGMTSSTPYYDTGGQGMVDLDKKIAEKYGYEVKGFSAVATKEKDAKTVAYEKISEMLDQGYSIHLSGCGNAPFSPTPSCHYVGIFRRTSGDKVMVADSSTRGNNEYDLKTVTSQINHLTFSAIKGTKSTKACSKETCDGGNSGSGSVNVGKGLTFEQAEKLAAYYNSDEVQVSKYGLDFGTSCGSGQGAKKNCVAFSAFFVQAFTDVGVTGTRTWTDGMGDTFVKHLKNDYGFETGTEPKPFSVFSSYGSMGHTGVIVGVDGDDIITVEASCGQYDAKVFHKKNGDFTGAAGDPYAYATSKGFKKEVMEQIVGK